MYLEDKYIPLWIKQQAEKYRPEYTLNAIPNYRKIPIFFSLNEEEYDAFSSIEGSSYSMKIINLYYNMRLRQEKKQHRLDTYNKYFNK